jgi:hypothetical protein
MTHDTVVPKMGTRQLSRPEYPIVALPAFVQATRDSGYKSTAAAISELVDNSLEAGASRVEVSLTEIPGPHPIQVEVADNGMGMSRDLLPLSLQFGGTTRFNRRDGLGRYGMGLPNGGLSQARCIEVLSWQSPRAVWMVRLALDEVTAGSTMQIASPVRVPGIRPASKTGTIIRLRACDRLDSRRISTIERRLHKELGRTFREFLYLNTRVSVNGTPIRPIDPLFLRAGINPTGARPFGPPLHYEISAPTGERSTVIARFVTLPLDRWHSLSNDQKNELAISKGAGVTVLRSRREIDSGWYFMGSKRKENYDDWWRCEVSFDPALDELFGVTHSKQRINPTDALKSILTPDIERIARQLNSIIRKNYCSIRDQGEQHIHLHRAESRDCLLEPIANMRATPTHAMPLRSEGLRHRDGGIAGLKFRIRLQELGDDALYLPTRVRDRLTVILNSNHPFVKSGFSNNRALGCSRDELALLFVAAARAEIGTKEAKARKIVRQFLDRWGRTLSAYA